MICKQCSQPYERGSKRGPVSAFCSRKCGEVWRARAKRLGPFFGTCYCGQDFTSNKSKQIYCSQACAYEVTKRRGSERWAKFYVRPEVYSYECDWCHLQIERDKPLGGTKRYHPECSKQAQAARYRAKTVKRQNANIKPSRIIVEQLVALYGTDCGICKEPIDLNVPRTSKMGATVDHIHPISKGGTDDLDNLQLAHWLCNVQKSDKVIEVHNG